MPGHPRILRLTSMTLRNRRLKVKYEFSVSFTNLMEFLDNESHHSQPEKQSTAILASYSIVLVEILL